MALDKKKEFSILPGLAVKNYFISFDFDSAHSSCW